ncbi:hypothetical protein ABW19_dt0207568 [Dactylella cylindrospora]|nr:hypothetical protein ABW19_dt0207568 [Dactylella cylindrospora]
MRSRSLHSIRPLSRLALRPSSHLPKITFPRTVLHPTYASRILPPLLSSSSRKYSTPSDSTLPPPPDSSSPSSPSSSQTTASFPLADKPSYELTFTCKKCTTRSTHKVSKPAYHKGVVIIKCPGCNVKHLIADHLGIFREKPSTIEDILKEYGEKIKKGVKYHDGDIEILPEEEIEAEAEGSIKVEEDKK